VVVEPSGENQKEKNKAHNPQASLSEVWKKPWNEVNGGAYGLGKSRKH